MPKILILSSLSQSLIGFRRDLIVALLSKGYRIYAAAPFFDNSVAEELIKMGATPIEYRLQRTGLNPLTDLRSILSIRKILQKYSIDLLLPYTIKPVIYGSLAGRTLGVPVVSLITGLGFTFSQSTQKARTLQHLTEFLYRTALKRNKAVIFQNSDDEALFRQRGLLAKGQASYVVDGSGIPLDRYPFRENPKDSPKVTFMLVARLIREKGVHLFLEAAERLKTEFPQAGFHIIGSPDNSPSSIGIEKLQELHKHGTIHFHGFQKDVAGLLARADVFVLPSYYREGVPRSILEALSVGMPIITTRTPGCKETVMENRNGILIGPNDLDALVTAMRYFLENPERIGPMGRESRTLAENRFNVDLINRAILTVLDGALPKINNNVRAFP